MNWLSSVYTSLEKRYNLQLEGVAEQLVVMLPGAGCAWAKKSGGCYMCGFSRATHRYTKGRLFPAPIFKGMLRYALKQRQGAEILAVYNGGSFLNPREIPISIPTWLSDKVAEHSSIRQLFVESRPEFVEPKLIQGMVTRLEGKILKVGIGLECVSDTIRDRCIHKGFLLKDYKRAVDVLRDHDVRVLTYVFLKPIFLNEAEAIEEAVKTIGYVFDHGSDEVALESAFVQEGTLMHKLFQKGEFKPPWLWSIVEVLKRTAHLGPVYLGGFTDEPKPVATPFNCQACSGRISEAMQRYRESLDVNVLDGLSCDCQKEWRFVLENTSKQSITEYRRGRQEII